MLPNVQEKLQVANKTYRGNKEEAYQEFNPLTPRRTMVSPFIERNFNSILRRDHQKKFPMSVEPMSR